MLSGSWVERYGEATISSSLFVAINQRRLGSAGTLKTTCHTNRSKTKGFRPSGSTEHVMVDVEA